MLAAALRDGTAHRRTTFEVFARRLPEGRRYGVVAGTGRFWKRCRSSGSTTTRWRRWRNSSIRDTLRYLARLPVRRRYRRLRRGRAVLPGSPVLSVRGSFAECVVLETLALSIFNHDTAIASAAARMVSAAGGRPLIEMGSRRTHERAAVAAARAAYIAGFAASSNLEAQRRYGVPARAPARTRSRCCTPAPTGPTSWPRSGPRSTRSGVGTTLLVDTYDVTTGVANAVAAAGTGARRGAHRLRRARRAGPSGARAARRLGATRPASWCPAISTSSPSRRCAPNRSTATASAPRWSPGRAPRPRAWSTSWSRWTASGGETQQPQGIPRRPQAGAAAGQADRHDRRGGRAPGRPAAAGSEPCRALTVPLVRGGRTASADLGSTRHASWWRPGCTACRGRA